MTRADLLALTPEALTRLSNVGLVKRAQKELAAGAVPMLTEEADGTVVASARDGASTRLPRGVPLQQSACTCGSSTVCRHRIAAVLAYQAQHAASGAGATPDVAWDPGTISDTTLLAVCGKQLVARADAAMATGIVVTVRPSHSSSTGTAIAPSVALPTATVQFLVPDDIAYAKCDCAKGHACEHVVLAVRAFRAGTGVITLCSGGGSEADSGAAAAPRAPLPPTAARSALDDALLYLVEQGLAAPGAPAALAHARAAAERERWWWIVDGLETIERLSEAYHRQSAAFRLDVLAREVGELVARTRAAAAPTSSLPPAYLLGSDTAGETPMEQVRLLSLGARLDADGDRRSVRIFFADPDTASVLVLDKAWASETRTGPELGQLFASSRMSAADLARGELVTRAARRRANGSLDLGIARGMKSSLLPSSGTWNNLPEPLLVRDLAAHAARRRARPPACLSPRSIGNAIAVVSIANIVDIDLASDQHSVTGLVEDPAGNRLVLHTEYRTVAPGAVTATAEALAARATHVAGELRTTPDGWSMHPLAFTTPDLVVVDLARPKKLAPHAADDASITHHAGPDAAARLATSIRDYVATALLKGHRTAAPTARALAKEADRLAAHRLLPLIEQAAAGTSRALLDLAVLHQLDDA